MVGVKRLGDHVRVVVLVARLACCGVESDAERGQTVLALLGQQRHHHRRVDTARQQHPDRHVGHHPARHRHPQRVDQRVLPVLLRPRLTVGVAAEFRCPVHRVGVASVRLDHPHGRRRQFAHAAVDGARGGHHRVKTHVVVQRVAVQFGVHVAAVQQGAHRRGEPQPARRLRDVERLDAQPVAAQRHNPGVAVSDREREHALETLDAARAPLSNALMRTSLSAVEKKR